MQESAQAFIEECQEENLADSTIKSHTTALTLFSDWLEETNRDTVDCTPADLQEFIEWLKANWDEPYIEIKNTIVWSLTRYYDYLDETGQIEQNPCSELDVVKLLVVDVAEDHLKRVRTLKSDSTVTNREFGLILFSDWLERDQQACVDELTPIDLENYAIFLQNQGYTDGSIIDRFASVSTLYQYLDRADVIAENPAEKVDLAQADIVDTYDNPSQKSNKLKEDIYYVTQDQKDAILQNVPSPRLRNELLVELLWQTGMRRGEIVQIELDDLDRDKREITIKGKNGKNRTVFYQPSLDDRLNIWLEGGYRDASLYAEESEYLFLTAQSEQLHPQQINRAIHQGAVAAGIQEELYQDTNGNARYKITPHTFRHGAAVQALKNGMDIKTLADILGHESLDTTKTYLHFTTEDERNAYRKFGPGGTEG